MTMSGKPKSGNEQKDKAVADFEEQRAFWEGVTKIQGIKVLPAPNGLKTFAFDLKEKHVYASDIFGEDENGKAKNSFGLGHELGHLEETLEVFDIQPDRQNGRPGGVEFFERVYLPRLKSDRTFALADNCFADIAINHKLAKKVPTMSDIELSIGQENLFKSDDMTQITDPKTGQNHPVPMHIQLPQTLLVEARYRPKNHPGLRVSPEVRQAIDRIKSVKVNGKNIVEVIQNENIDMYTRYLILQKYIMPEIEKLKEEDKKNKTEDKSQQGEGGEGGEPSEGQEGEPQEGGKDSKPKKKSLADRIKDKLSSKKGEGQKPENDKSQPQKSEAKGKQKTKGDIFAEDYERAKQKTIPTTSIEDLEKTFKEWKKENGDPTLKANKLKAEALGVPIEDLINYQNISAKLEQNGKNETIDKLIERIVVERMRQKTIERGYVRISEGDEIDDFAQIIPDTKSGNLDPVVSNVFDIQESKGQMYGEVEISVVGDRSGSMSGEKLQALQEAIVWIMNSQKNLQDKLKEGEQSQNGLLKGLDVKWEVFSFQNDANDRKPVVPMTSEFTEKKRIETMAHFNSAPGGSTPDFNCLEAISSSLKSDEAKVKKLKEKELKKVVFVFTDGQSDDSGRVQRSLEELRNAGVVVIGIGIGSQAQSVTTTYGTGSIWVQNVSDLLPSITEKLENEFKDLLPLK